MGKRQIYLNGPLRETEEEAVEDSGKLLKEAKSPRSPDRSATVAHLLDEWMELADHELSTETTNCGYIDRKLKPTIGHYTVRQFQDRVDVLSELYNHLRHRGRPRTQAAQEPPLLQRDRAPQERCGPPDRGRQAWLR